MTSGENSGGGADGDGAVKASDPAALAEGADGADGERRRKERVSAAVVTELVSQDKPHMAMLHDFSSTGALVLTRAKVAAGDAVELRIHLGEELQETIVVAAKVVRRETWASGESFWPFSVAVKFDTPSEGHEARMRAIRARQEELGIAPKRG